MENSRIQYLYSLNQEGKINLLLRELKVTLANEKRFTLLEKLKLLEHEYLEINEGITSAKDEREKLPQIEASIKGLLDSLQMELEFQVLRSFLTRGHMIFSFRTLLTTKARLQMVWPKL